MTKLMKLAASGAVLPGIVAYFVSGHVATALGVAVVAAIALPSWVY